MNFSKTTSLLLVGAIGFCGSLIADNFRVVSLSQIPNLASLEYPNGDEVTTVPVSISSFSKPMPIPQSRELALYDKAPLPNEEKRPILNLKFPKSAGDVIVLLKAVQTAQGPTYRYEILDDSSSAFPAGSVFICNYMPESVIIRLGDKQVLVDSNDRSVVPLAKQEQPFDDGVAFAAEIDGHGRVFSTSSWYLVPSMKIFCVIYKDDHGQPKIRRIRLTS
ncbi:hypothetical protein [Cerasicoccus fimbriatus]|uniref:hypothetical protein n=1 Tax=Cerasicoccus fimbriatus TaxID=3014554 RepID=UPI0022B44889|nr:hypothetical protein [Cerasicoccus sp. TK19100]